jgi:hypothetical protein
MTVRTDRLLPTVLAAMVATSSLMSNACSDISTTADPNEVLFLSASPTAISADGFSATTITAQIDPNANPNYRDVIFTTTLGTFPASAEDPSRIVVTADADGLASTILQSVSRIGTADVKAEIRDGDAVLIARTIEVRFEPFSTSDVIRLEASAARAPADGATVTNIVAVVTRAMPIQQREILFTTTNGTFGSGLSPQTATRSAGSNALATVGLISPRTPGFALVTATVNGIQSNVVVEFDHAYPDSATLSVFGSLQLKATFATKVSLSMQLFRNVGEVTEGTEVRFRVFDDSTGNMFGFFNGVTPSDSKGLVTAEFTPGNTNERGEATLRGRVVGTEVSARVKIEIIDP